LKPIADSNAVKLSDQPPQDAPATYEKLSRLTGNQFDREFVAAMIKTIGR